MRFVLPNLLVLVLVILLGPPSAAAQWRLRLDRLSAEVGGAYEGSRLDQRQGEFFTAKTWLEWLRITTGGALRDPRILAFHSVARLQFQQGEYLAAPDSASSQVGGNGLLGTAVLQFFRSSPVSGSFRIVRSHDFRHMPMGGSVDEGLSQWVAEVRDNNPLLPAVFSYESELRRTRWTSGLRRTFLPTDTRTGTFRLRANNSRTNLLLERLAFEETSSDLAFTRYAALLTQRQSWGEGKTLRSRIRYSDRSGTRSVRAFQWGETVHLQPSSSIATDLNATYRHSVGGDAMTDQVNVRASVTRDAGGDLVLGSDLILEQWRTGVVRRGLLQVGPRGSYSRGLPGGVGLSATASSNLSMQGQGSHGEVSADIVQEPHTVGPLGQFELIRPFADPESVVVSSEDGSTVFERRIDYEIVYSHPFTVVIAVPGGRFEEEQEVFVDYRYEVAPRVAARSATYYYSLGLDGWGLRLFHQRRGQKDFDDVPPEVLPVLRNHDQEVTGAAFALTRGRASISLRVERRRQTTDRFDFRDDRATGGLTLRLSPRVLLEGTSRHSRLRGSERKFDSRSIEYSAAWRPSYSVRVRAFASEWIWEDEEGRNYHWGGGVLLEWRAAAHTMSVRFDHSIWFPVSIRDENRLRLQFSREL